MTTLISALLVKRFAPKIPNLLIGLIIGSFVAILFSGSGANIQLVGEIPGNLPPLSLPDFSLASIKMLAPEAFAVALLGLIEAVSISRAIATKSNQRINANQEFIGQGLSNLIGSFFSSYAGSGSFTRSGINYASGAKTPLSAIFASVMLLFIVLLIAPLTAYLPVAAMGGVILIVAYNLIDIHHIKSILKYSRSESSILLTTFFSTLFLELEFAIYLGVLLSLVLFLARTSTPEIVTLAPDVDTSSDKKQLTNINKKPLNQCPQLKILRIDMSIYFGSINHIQNRLHQLIETEKLKHILIVGTGINFIDLSGTEALVTDARRLQDQGGGLYFSKLKASVYEYVSKNCFVAKVGNKHFFDSNKDAIKKIYKRLDPEICATCTVRVFSECK
jgi:SulP family sulfate permease